MLDELSSLRSQSVEMEVPVGGRADDDLVDVLGVEISVLAEIHTECTGERVDKKVKELVFVDFTVCLLFLLGHTSASRPLN